MNPRRWAGILVLALSVLVASSATNQSFARYASIVVDSVTGQVLHEVNADTRNYPASLTKMMTLYLVFEALEKGKLKLNQRLKVSHRAASQPASRLGLRRNHRITVEQAILALVTKSANDVAVVVAETLGGTERKFARLMNKKAEELGMKRTNFRNASGLPNRRQLSTARDMSVLALALIKHYPKYYDYFSTKKFRYRGRVHKNHNSLLKSFAGTDGLKTGYTRASGYNLAASAVRNGRRLVAVVFGGRTSRSRDRHVRDLLAKGFEQPIPLVRPRPATKPSKLIAVNSKAGKQPKKPEKSPNVLTVDSSEATPTPKTKPGKVTLAKKDPARRITKASRWGVQVGAFYRQTPAKRAAKRAAKKLPKLLGHTHVKIRQIKGRKGLLYRAQLIGLSKKQARLACRRLKSAKIDCLVVRWPKNLKLAANAGG